MSDSRSLQFQLDTVRDELALLLDEQQQLHTKLQTAQREAADTLQRIRDVIVTAIRQGEKFEWTSLDEHVTTRFEQMGEHNQKLLARLKEEEDALVNDNAHVRQAMELHEQASEALAQIDIEIDAALDALPDVQAARERLDDISLLAERLREQKADAEEEATNKRRAYEEDRYFLYLWRRGYGTALYPGGALTKRFDRWLAERCHYNDNSRQYDLLLNIPPRLQATLDEATAQVATLQAEIDLARARVAAEFKRADAQQHVDEAATLVAKTKAVLTRHAQRIEATRQEIQSIETGEHPLHQAIMALVEDRVKDSELARFVGKTISQDDDLLLTRLEAEQLRQCQLQAQLSTNGAVQQMKQNEIDELEHAVQRAKRLEEAALVAATRRHSRHGGHWGDWGGGMGGGHGGGNGGFGGGGFGGGGFGRGGGFGGGGFKRGGGF